MLFIQLNTQAQSILHKGDLAPNFEEVDDEGNAIVLESYRGKVVLLNFTATWCGYCWYTYDQMDALQKEYGDQLKIISFHLDDDKARWNDIAQRKNIQFDVSSIWDSEQKKSIYEQYGADGFPYFVVIDHNGVIRKKWFGNLEKKLSKQVKTAINKIN